MSHDFECIDQNIDLRLRYFVNKFLFTNFIAGSSAEMFAYGTQLWMNQIGLILSFFYIHFIILKVLYPLKITSVYTVSILLKSYWNGIWCQIRLWMILKLNSLLTASMYYILHKNKCTIIKIEKKLTYYFNWIKK